MPLYIAQSGDLEGCHACLTHWLTTLKDRATQLLIKFKTGALVTQYGHNLAQCRTKIEMVLVQKIITTRSTRVLHLPIRSEAGLGHLRARKPNSHLRVFALVHYAFPLALFALLLCFAVQCQSCNQQEYLFRSGCNCDTGENLKRDENREKS